MASNQSLLVESWSKEVIDYLTEKDLWKAFLDFTFQSKPRLNRARVFFNILRREEVPLLKRAFKNWQEYDEYVLLKGTHSSTGATLPIAVKCSKRGNDVFFRRMKRKLDVFNDDKKTVFFSSSDFYANKYMSTRCLWVTLNYDSKRCSLHDAWLNFSSEVNLWVTNLRNKYGRIHYTGFTQAFPREKYEDGSLAKAYAYPHIHLVMFFEDCEFKAFPHLEYNKKSDAHEVVYRIDEKDELHDQGKWHSFSDVKAIASPAALWNYSRKHCYNASMVDTDEADLNNAVMWLYRKRSFNMSRRFKEMLSEFIDKNLRNSKVAIQRKDLYVAGQHPGQEKFDGSDRNFWVWEFGGIFSFSRLQKEVEGLDRPPPDIIELDCSVYDKLYMERLESKLKAEKFKSGGFVEVDVCQSVSYSVVMFGDNPDSLVTFSSLLNDWSLSKMYYNQGFNLRMLFTYDVFVEDFDYT